MLVLCFVINQVLKYIIKLFSEDVLKTSFLLCTIYLWLSRLNRMFRNIELIKMFESFALSTSFIWLKNKPFFCSSGCNSYNITKHFKKQFTIETTLNPNFHLDTLKLSWTFLSVFNPVCLHGHQWGPTAKLGRSWAHKQPLAILSMVPWQKQHS